MTRAEEHQDLIDEIASALAYRYARKCRHVEVAELQQVARLAMVYAIDKYDPAQGTFGNIPLRAYLWFVARNDVARAAMRAASPVSCSHRPGNAMAARRAVFDETDVGTTTTQSWAKVPLDELVEKAQRTRMVRERLEALVGPEGAVFALKVLTGDVKPQQVAEKSKVPTTAVYSYNQRIREVLSADPTLFALWSSG